MLQAADRQPWYSRWAAKGLAYSYYRMVRWFGSKHFVYRQAEDGTAIEPTLSQLRREAMVRNAA